MCVCVCMCVCVAGVWAMVGSVVCVSVGYVTHYLDYLHIFPTQLSSLGNQSTTTSPNNVKETTLHDYGCPATLWCDTEKVPHTIACAMADIAELSDVCFVFVMRAGGVGWVGWMV